MNGTTNRWRLGVMAAVVCLLATACGGAASPAASPSAAAASTAASASPSPSPSPVPTGYAGPAATIEYAIWGDPTELKNQQAIVAAFHAIEPKITVKVTVSDWDAYWDKLQTGLAGGAAPDVFAMDGPLFPDYASRDVLLDLTPYVQAESYPLSSLADLAVKDFTTADGRQMGLPRDLNVIALFYNKKMFDAAGITYPDDTCDWNKLIEVGQKETLDTNHDGKLDKWVL